MRRSPNHADTGRQALRQAGGVLFAVLLVLSGCGGGGGGGGSGASSSGGASAPLDPVAVVVVDVADGFAPLRVRFDASGSRDPGGSVVGYAWSFGDGSESRVGPIVTHTFDTPGSYQVALEITGSSGRSAVTRTTIRARGATLSGTISIDPASAVDSDLNNRDTVPVGNNSFETAQALATPVRLGGFVNLPGTGSSDGNFFATGDPEDFFALSVAGPARAVLAIADPNAAMDLELYEPTSPPTLVDASVSSERTEDLAIPAAGTWFLRVVARRGASNYVLTVDDSGDAARVSASAKRLSDAFVSGDVLVQGGAGLQRQLVRYTLGSGSRRDRFPLHPAGPRREQVPALEVVQPRTIGAAGAVVTPALERRYRTLLAAADLRGDPNIEVAEVNVIHRPLFEPNDPRRSQQWHYDAIELPAAWQLTTGRDTGGPPVVVAVVDTGVLVNHPDLAGSLLRDGAGRVIGFDFIQDAARANDGDGIDSNPDDPGDDAFGPGQGSFHGTHVAGTIAADTDNGIGVAGVSWGARIMPVRALGVGGGTSFDVQQAIRYAAGLPNVSGTVPPVAADIINLSLGSTFFSETEQQTLNEVRARGIFVVASAGNSATNLPTYPAAYEGVLAVSATTVDDRLASYSSFGAFVDIAAPGGDVPAGSNVCGPLECVISTTGSGGGSSITFGYGPQIGTSMAAPHVSGVIALMKAVFPGLIPQTFDQLLAAGMLTEDLGSPGRDELFGFGRISARRAIDAALAAGSVDQTGVLSASASQLNFRLFTASLDFAISNLGPTPVQITVNGTAPWLRVDPLSVDATGIGTYRARVERSDLLPGLYSDVIRIDAGDASVQPLQIAVLMRVVDAVMEADAGLHYVILVDEAYRTVTGEAVRVRDGAYRFTLRDVPAGRYRLFAGTDADDDGFICTAGEACGAYPSLADPLLLEVDGRVQAVQAGLDFASEFRDRVDTTAASASAGAANRSGLAVSGRP